MGKTQFELWLDACNEFNSSPWMLETCLGMEETGLYMTKRKYECKYREYFEQPVFHVWYDGKHEVATTNYSDAYKTWDGLIAPAIK